MLSACPTQRAALICKCKYVFAPTNPLDLAAPLDQKGRPKGQCAEGHPCWAGRRGLKVLLYLFPARGGDRLLPEMDGVIQGPPVRRNAINKSSPANDGSESIIIKWKTCPIPASPLNEVWPDVTATGSGLKLAQTEPRKLIQTRARKKGKSYFYGHKDRAAKTVGQRVTHPPGGVEIFRYL